MQVIRHTVERAFLALFVLGLPTSLLAQNVIGSSGPSGGYAINSGPPPVTIIDNFFVARTSFTAKRARFNWSNAPCIGAAKIKFFRASGPAANPTYHFLEERGPFDVIRASNQLVNLYPPVSITPGEHIGITALTACGGPVAFTPG